MQPSGYAQTIGDNSKVARRADNAPARAAARSNQRTPSAHGGGSAGAEQTNHTRPNRAQGGGERRERRPQTKHKAMSAERGRYVSARQPQIFGASERKRTERRIKAGRRGRRRQKRSGHRFSTKERAEHGGPRRTPSTRLKLRRETERDTPNGASGRK